MDDLQIAFSILGVLLILAIIGHGMWTIRKNDRAADAQAKALAKQRQQRDQNGFDADGIGEVRVVRGASEDSPQVARDSNPKSPPKATPSASKATAQPVKSDRQEDAEMPDFDAPEEESVADPMESLAVQDESFAATDDLSMRVEADERLTPTAPKAEPVQQQAVAAETTAPEKPLKPEQMDLHIDEVTESEGLTAAPEEVIALHVKGDIQGDVLLQQMTELGFKFGEFDIFHRHETTAGTGPVLFSLANMFNPGTFDIDAMETFKTQGIALFLALPVKGSAQQAFTMMHNAAQKIAAAHGNGQVLDEHRNPLTRQTVQHIQQRIREFERRQLLRNHKLHE